MQAQRMRSLFLSMAMGLSTAVAAAGCGGSQQQAAEPASPPAASGQSADQGGQTAAAPAADAAQPAPAEAGGADQGGAATGGPTEAEKKLAGQAMAMMEQMAAIAEANPKDCDKAATEYQALVDKNRSLIAAGKTFNQDPAKKKWFEDTYGQQMMAAAGKMMPLLQNCKDNAKLKKVFDSMGS